MNDTTANSKKILIIAPALGTTSGWGRMVCEILDQFKKKSVIFTVCAEIVDSEFKQYPYTHLAKGWRGFIANIFLVRKIAREHDIVHAFDGWPYALYGYFAVLGTKKNLFITGVGTYTILPLVSGLRSFFTRKAYLRASQIMCISRYTEGRILKELPTARTSVVHLGLTDLPLLATDYIAKRQEIYSIQNRYPILLTVGAIKNRKGQLDSVKACALLIKKYPRLLYVMVGGNKDGVYMNKIRNCIQSEGLENAIKVIPDVRSDEELSFFYQLCDVFILASRNSNDNHFEGFGLALLEAAQFGKPGIGTRGCGVEDAIVDGQTGFLVDQGQPEAIAAALEKLLSGDKAFFAQNAKEFSHSFSWSATVDSYLAVYSQ